LKKKIFFIMKINLRKDARTYGQKVIFKMGGGKS